MKSTKTLLLMALAAFLVTACQNDDEQMVSTGNEGDTKTVKFEIDASNIQHEISTKSTLKYTPQYANSGFNIYAFKKAVDSDEYLYEKTINTSAWTSQDNNKKITGTAELRIGTYKFLTAYGLTQSNITLPAWANTTELTEGLRIRNNGGGALQEIFLQPSSMSIDDVPSYDLGLTSDANPTVTSTVSRAVSRVDILFIKAKKTGNEYTEQKYINDNALGGFPIDTLQFRFGGVKNQMDFFGNNLTGSINQTVTYQAPNVAQYITIGNAEETGIGKDGFIAFDNITAGNLIKGGAHIFGTYLFPNVNSTPSSDVTIYIKPVGGIGRTITLPNNQKIPLERNKVTLVKIYVLDNDDPTDPEEPNVFTTSVKFEVQVVTVWDGHHEVVGEVD